MLEPTGPITRSVVPIPVCIPVSSAPYTNSSGMLYFSRVSLRRSKYSAFVIGFTARPRELSNDEDQYIPILSWCLVMNRVAQFFPSPPWHKESPSRAHRIFSACSRSRFGLRGKPRRATSRAYSTITCCSSYVSRLFFPLWSVRLVPPFSHLAKVLWSKLIRFLVLE